MSVLRSVLALVLVAQVPFVQAAGKGVNRARSDASSPAVHALETLRTARALARYGEDRKDALALIVAARMTHGTQMEVVPLIRLGRRDADPLRPDAMASVEARSAAWLARAKRLASDRPDLIALADDSASHHMRGKVPTGPRVHPGRIKAGFTEQFELTFEGGKPAAVAISGDEDSRLDLYVLDENGERVCSDTDAGHEKMCRWTPKWSGRFVVRVVNRGPESEYLLLFNR